MAHVHCAVLKAGVRLAAAAATATLMMTAQAGGEHAGARARMVAEIEAMYAETRAETGLAAMSPAVRAAMRRLDETTAVLGRRMHAARQEEITQEIEVIMLSAQALAEEVSARAAL